MNGDDQQQQKQEYGAENVYGQMANGEWTVVQSGYAANFPHHYFLASSPPPPSIWPSPSSESGCSSMANSLPNSRKSSMESTTSSGASMFAYNNNSGGGPSSRLGQQQQFYPPLGCHPPSFISYEGEEEEGKKRSMDRNGGIENVPTQPIAAINAFDYAPAVYAGAGYGPIAALPNNGDDAIWHQWTIGNMAAAQAASQMFLDILEPNFKSELLALLSQYGGQPQQQHNQQIGQQPTFTGQQPMTNGHHPQFTARPASSASSASSFNSNIHAAPRSVSHATFAMGGEGREEKEVGHAQVDLNAIKDFANSPIIDFLCDLLADPNCQHICSFIGPREFLIHDPPVFTSLLNLAKNSAKQTKKSYLQISRALKSFELRQLNGQVMMRKVANKRNQFKFFPDMKP